MNYTLTVYIGDMPYRTFSLKASIAAGNALMAATPKAMKLFRQKVTQLADTYSWTHADVSIAGVQNTIRAFG